MAAPNDVFLFSGAANPKDVILRPNSVLVSSTIPALAISAWVVGAVAIALGAVSIQPSAAQAQWIANSPSTVQGGAVAAPAPAITTWVVPTPSATVISSAPLTGGLYRPHFQPRVPHRQANPRYAFPAPARSRWFVLSVDTELGDVTRTIDPASSDWVVRAVRTTPNPDEEILILLLTEKG